MSRCQGVSHNDLSSTGQFSWRYRQRRLTWHANPDFPTLTNKNGHHHKQPVVVVALFVEELRRCESVSQSIVLVYQVNNIFLDEFWFGVFFISKF